MFPEPLFSLAETIELATAFATIVLALATMWLAHKTGHMVSEMRETRKQEYSPRIACYLTLGELHMAVLRIINLGRAPAVDVALSITFRKDGQVVEERPFKWTIMAAIEDRDLILPDHGVIWKLTEAVTTIDIVGDYADSLGFPFKVKQTVRVNDFVETWNKSRMALRKKDQVDFGTRDD
jgi:hypothetical protein